MHDMIKIPIVWLVFLIATVLLATIQQVLSLPVELGLAQAGPASGTLLFLYLIWKERVPLKEFIYQKDHPFYMVIFVVLLPFLLALVTKTIHSELTDTTAIIDSVSFNRLWLLLLWVPFGAFLEELGWRGYLQRLFDRTMKNHILGDIIIGTLWTLWHISNFQYGILFLIGQWMLLVSISIILGHLMRRFGYNVLVAMLMHISINLGVIYLMYTESFTSLTSLLYGVITVLFTIYFIASAKKVENI